MQVVILAGGLGTRLRPITLTVPKPLVNIGDRPFLSYQLSLLNDQGFEDILLLTGHLGEQVEECFRDGSALGLRLCYTREPHPLGTGGALRAALDKLDDELLLLYGDSYLPIDYRAFVDDFRQSEALASIVVFRDRRGETSVPGNVALDEDRWVIQYEKGGGLPYIEAGVSAFHKAAPVLLPAGVSSSLESDLFPTLIQDRQLKAYVTTQRFYDIGTPDRRRQMEEYCRDHLSDASSH